MGLSPNHLSKVSLILNPITGHISPNFHVIFDGWFSTIPSLINIYDPPSFWNEFDRDKFIHQIPLDKDSAITLDDEYLTPQERGEMKGVMYEQLRSALEFNLLQNNLLVYNQKLLRHQVLIHNQRNQEYLIHQHMLTQLNFNLTFLL